ncbi:hypothetical protein CTAYLR_002979 [Chrysophaeum taylorii]|uniref:DUF3598 domain-containing protein n=1 Tax=Chrysophaeum taylorii TaxID=2483200 RepID=A0AAD7XGH4_9STRA|nr:hypothetical protein CTAYLR_002979 [Chrysophaeum taylorii]
MLLLALIGSASGLTPQWASLTSQTGNWEGVWTTYDQHGVVQSETEASWILELEPENRARHTLRVGDQTIPVATYTPDNLGKQQCAGAGMVCGPSLLRSGLVSTELSLRHGASRVRVTVQHAPAFDPDGVEAMLLYRTIVCRERCDGTGAPTKAKEEGLERPKGVDEASFWRGVPPTAWQRDWEGDTITGEGHVTPTRLDDWHLKRSAEASYTLHLPGAIRLFAPALLRPAIPAPFRLAWLPWDGHLLRAQARAVALEPSSSFSDEDKGERFRPPRLLSLEVDEVHC